MVVSGFAFSQMVGGFSNADIKDYGVVQAAKFAVKAKNISLARVGKNAYKLVEITRAEVQVVAGINYHVCFEAKLGNNTKNADVVVYKDLQKKMSLTSWDWKECSIK